MSVGSLGGLLSPKAHVLAQLEGMPGDIDAQARELVSAAEVMERTSTRLQRLADGTDTISKAESMDAVREAAGDVAPGLSKAATRYRLTGGTLVTYAAALESAQLRIGPMVEDIEVKHQAVADAREVARDAQGVVNDHGTQWVWEAEVTEAQKAAAESGLTSARAALGVAEGELEDAWEGFDQAFGVWEDAYDAAVDGIDDAFDAADNDDAWGEDALTVLGYVAVVLSVVALFCTGPLALVIMALGAAVAALTLAINIAKMTRGRGNWLDLTMAVIGIIPFVRPLGMAIKGGRAGLRGMRTAQEVFTAGRGMVRGSVRSTMSTFEPVQWAGNPVQWTGRWTSKLNWVPDAIGKLTSKFNWVRNAGGWTMNHVNDARAWGRTGMLQAQFSIKNATLSRPGMNWYNGGHSNLTAFGDFLRGKGSNVVGSEMLDWANKVAPHVGRDNYGIAENIITDGGAAFFVAEDRTPFGDFVGRFDQ